MSNQYKGLIGIGAGNMLASMIIAGFLLGWILDTLFGTAPWLMLLCSALGFIGGFRRAHILAGIKEDEPPARDDDTPEKKP